jgi:hypothetical protein
MGIKKKAAAITLAAGGKARNNTLKKGKDKMKEDNNILLGIDKVPRWEDKLSKGQGYRMLVRYTRPLRLDWRTASCTKRTQF